MKLFEISDSFADMMPGSAPGSNSDDLALKMRNVLGQADSKHSHITLSYETLSNMLGMKVDKDLMSKLYDSHPDMQSIIADVNDQGVVLSTDEQDPEAISGAPDMGAGAKSVDQMAHNVVSREF